MAHDAFVRLYRYDGVVERPGALLRTITVNVCRSWLLAEARGRSRVIRHGLDVDSLPAFERELDDSLRRLPYDQRAVVVLRYWLGLSEAEIAEALGASPAAAGDR